MPDSNQSEFSSIDAIIAYEQGELSEEATIEMFQHLVNTGEVWKLQGHYGRTAAALLQEGIIQPAEGVNNGSVA